MTDTEIQDLHARFERAAFYDHEGRPKLRPPVKLTDLAWVRIETHHGWAHEWWKDYTGIVILAKLIFHETLPTEKQKWKYLYEVTPIKINGHSVYVARSIIASCVHVIEEYQCPLHLLE